jgi:GTPase
VVLSDTVGFIRDLPHALVAAFHATLEETANSDLLLHVVDSASPERESQIDAVNDVLRSIGAGDVPQIMVFNKIDLTGAPAAVNRDECGNITGVFLSAVGSQGVSLLRDALAEVAQRVSTAESRNTVPDVTV